MHLPPPPSCPPPPAKNKLLASLSKPLLFLLIEFKVEALRKSNFEYSGGFQTFFFFRK